MSDDRASDPEIMDYAEVNQFVIFTISTLARFLLPAK